VVVRGVTAASTAMGEHGPSTGGVPEAGIGEIGWSGALIGAIFVADIVVFLGLILEDRRDRRARQSKDRRAA